MTKNFIKHVQNGANLANLNGMCHPFIFFGRIMRDMSYFMLPTDFKFFLRFDTPLMNN